MMHSTSAAAAIQEHHHETAPDTYEPFWFDARCECWSVTCPDCGEIARFFAEEAQRNQARREHFLSQPEPAVQLTGEIVSVEWEHEDGGRWWVQMDAGRLDWEIWSNGRVGTFLSDVDSPL